MPGIFTIFGASGLLATVFVYVALPEAKGRTLQEMEDYFQVSISINVDFQFRISIAFKEYLSLVILKLHEN